MGYLSEEQGQHLIIVYVLTLACLVFSTKWSIIIQCKLFLNSPARLKWRSCFSLPAVGITGIACTHHHTRDNDRSLTEIISVQRKTTICPQCHYRGRVNNEPVLSPASNNESLILWMAEVKQRQAHVVWTEVLPHPSESQRLHPAITHGQPAPELSVGFWRTCGQNLERSMNIQCVSDPSNKENLWLLLIWK